MSLLHYYPSIINAVKPPMAHSGSHTMSHQQSSRVAKAKPRVLRSKADKTADDIVKGHLQRAEMPEHPKLVNMASDIFSLPEAHVKLCTVISDLHTILNRISRGVAVIDANAMLIVDVDLDTATMTDGGSICARLKSLHTYGEAVVKYAENISMALDKAVN